MSRDSVKMLSAALDEGPAGTIVLRGVLDPDSLRLLKVGSYQREVGSLSSINDLIKALEGDGVPDIELGCRGADYREREGSFYLPEEVYIVDGLQRVTAGMELLKKANGKLPRIGATVHFSTDERWERNRFRTLNASRSKVSPNILIRNSQADYPMVKTLFNLTHDSSCLLNRRVCWTQRQTREQLLTALTFFKAIGALHSHLVPGLLSHRWQDLVEGIQSASDSDRIGPNIFRANVSQFFELVDAAWGIRIVTFKEGATHLHATFLTVLGLVLSRHEDFWKGSRLVVERDLVRKISQFPVHDPQVRTLASGGGTSGKMLYQLLVEFINSGKRSRRLRARDAEFAAQTALAAEQAGAMVQGAMAT